MTVVCFVTQLPLETNRVDLDPDVKDDWGLPAMRITATSHPDDFKCMEFFRQKSIEILEVAGAKKFWAGPVNDSRGGAHNRGTCRMGNDPKTSVVNKFHRAPRRPEPVHRGRQRPRHRWTQPPHDDDPGARVRAADNIIPAAKAGTLTGL
jgi:hypothetical protein